MAQNEIFVFGSNLAGRHGAGSALEAFRNHGAIYGQGIGWQGNSYAIPTKDSGFNTLPLRSIEFYVHKFLREAATLPDVTFNVVAIGCGLAGFSPAQIGPLFRGYTSNVILPPEFRPYVAS